jgi:hypothetical protein
VSVAAKEVLEVDQIQVLTDGGYSNAEEIARCGTGISGRAMYERSVTVLGIFMAMQPV